MEDLKNKEINENFTVTEINNKKIYKCIPCDFICSYDNFKWNTHVNTSKHKRNFDNKLKEDYIKKNEDKQSVIKCESCNKMFNKQYYDIYHKHTSLHRKNVEYNEDKQHCKYCNKTFSKYYTIFHTQSNRHIENVKKYNCEIPCEITDVK